MSVKGSLRVLVFLRAEAWQTLAAAGAIGVSALCLGLALRSTSGAGLAAASRWPVAAMGVARGGLRQVVGRGPAISAGLIVSLGREVG